MVDAGSGETVFCRGIAALKPTMSSRFNTLRLPCA
jgi:hypothetical protein